VKVSIVCIREELERLPYTRATEENIGCLATASELCVKVLVPGEDPSKRPGLYFEADALEVWTCNLQGHLLYYLARQPLPQPNPGSFNHQYLTRLT
jgi:hypothetical protein